MPPPPFFLFPLQDKTLASAGVQAAWDKEQAASQDAESRRARERRTRRINEMLCYRIYKRNLILPIKKQVPSELARLLYDARS